ncbi:unnamed protein product [Rhodiola kirilowii]
MLSLSSCSVPNLPLLPGVTLTPPHSQSFLRKDANLSNRRRKYAKQMLFFNNLYLQQYVDSGAMEDARKLFDQMPIRTLVSWTLLLSGYVKHGFAVETLALFERMLWGECGEILVPDSYVYSVVLRACAAVDRLDYGRTVHGYVIKGNVDVDSFVQNALLNMYASCGDVEDMRAVFDGMDQPDLVAFTSVLSGYVKNGFQEEGLSLFHDIANQGMPLDTFLVSLALGMCATLCDLDLGLQLHCYAIKNGFGSSLFLNNSLLDLYAKVGELEAMEQVFFQTHSTNVVSWNTCITGFVYNSFFLEAVRYFRFMIQKIKSCDNVTIINILKAVTMLGDIRTGRELHAYIVRTGSVDSRVMWSLLNMYIECTDHLSSDVQQAVSVKLINRFDGSYLDEFIISSMLKSCSLRNDLESGKVIHSLIIKSDMGNSDQIVVSLLISMYYKCGFPEAADMVFTRVEAPSSAPWSAFISGRLYLIAARGILRSYSYLVSLNVGRQMHAYITKAGCVSHSVIGNSLVKMYSSCGAISEADQVFDLITDKTPFSWATMMSARVEHGYSAEALELFSHIRCNDNMKDPTVISSYLKLCAQLGLVDDAYSLFTSMEHVLGMKPSEELYACMVDVFGRAGLSEDLQEFISVVTPHLAGPLFWKAVFSSCRLLGNMEVAKLAVERLLELEPTNASACVLLEQVLLTLGKWDEASKLSLSYGNPRVLLHSSNIEIRNKIYHFFSDQIPAHDVSSKLGELRAKMLDLCYIADKNHMLHNAEEGGHGGVHTEMQALAFGLISSANAVPIRVMKSVRMCGDCHSAFKFISTFVNRELVVKDSSTFHNFREGRCTCRDRW